MARFALTWTDDGRPFAIDLDPTRDHLIGRDPRADIVIPGPTVSRQHAVLHGLRTGFTVENASSTNPTRLAGTAIAGATRLENGAEIDTGGRRSRFWDLAAGDRSAVRSAATAGTRAALRTTTAGFAAHRLLMPRRRSATPAASCAGSSTRTETSSISSKTMRSASPQMATQPRWPQSPRAKM